MPGDLVVDVVVEPEMEAWRPLAQAVLAFPHLIVTGVLSVASVVVATVTGVVVLLTGRVPSRLASFQVMTLRERVRCYSYFFALRTGHPRFNLALGDADPGDDASVTVSAVPVPVMPRLDALRRFVVLSHLLVLVPIGFVMDVCYPLWIVLAAVNRGWPPAFRRLLVATERWVIAFAAYSVFVTNTPPAFGLAAYGYDIQLGSAVKPSR